MKEPTQEQIKKLWEWVGLKYEEPYWVSKDCQEGECCFYGGYYAELLKTITLNNLFRWAVPKLSDGTLIGIDFIPPYHRQKEWLCNVEINSSPPIASYRALGDSPALALFWAIQQVIEKAA